MFDRKIMFRVLLLFFLWSLSSARQCNFDDELPCLLSEECIHKMQWCDGLNDCKDHSDERFCNADSCPPGFLKCENKKCIPVVAMCNGYDNCGDGSDETCERPVNNTVDRIIPDLNELALNETDAVSKAASYLLRARLNGGWHDFTPRAIVALAFAANSGKIPDNWMSLLKKELSVKILVNLMQKNLQPNLADTALYINALLATCQDPRNYKGIDLVRLLRSEVDSAQGMNLPSVLLTLCLANEVRYNDVALLLEMYDQMGEDRIGSKALVMMALACIVKNTKRVSRAEKLKLQAYMKETNALYRAFDGYTELLHSQVLIALGKNIVFELSDRQRSDGSFGDMLSTYYAIPLLLNKSSLDLKCPRTEEKALQLAIRLPNDTSAEKEVTYSLWMDKDSFMNSHSLVIPVRGNKTFYDVMKIAEGKSADYRFLYDSSVKGKLVYSLAGIANDAETGRAWTLYRGNKNGAMIDLRKYLTKVELGVDKIFPSDGEHFVFLFERISSLV